MTLHTLAAAAFALAVSSVPASAVSIDLAAYNLFKGASLAQSDAVTVLVDLASTPDTFLADVFDAGSFEGAVLGTPSAGTAFLGLFEPLVFDGDLIDFDVDVAGGMAAGLFFDSVTMTYLLAELTLPQGTPFSADLFIDNASAELFAVAPIPLPAAAPLMLAGLGALAVAARRRKA